MSKVVHLSIEAHTAAKDYCKKHGLKMSDWVARLIFDKLEELRASSTDEVVETPTAPSAGVPPRKKLHRFEDNKSTADEAYGSAPFWAQDTGSANEANASSEPDIA